MKTLYDGFGKVKSLEMKMNGNNVDREVYHRGDAVAVILYNPEKNTIILTNQKRPGIIHNQPHRTYSYELVAGLVDKDLTKREIVHEEILEEVGYDISLKDINFIKKFYSSPGGFTEQVYLYYAEYSDNNKINNGGGSDKENEEIEVVEILLDTVKILLKTDKIDDAKTLIGLQWLLLNKALLYES